MSAEFVCLELRSADDLIGFEAALLKFGPDRINRLALFFRVPGEYEDGSREKARAAVDRILAAHELADRAEMITVVGCEGATTPCAYVFADVKDAGSDTAPRGSERRLSIGLARGLPPSDDNELDKAIFVQKIADLVCSAIADGGMTARDVVTVFINTPPPVLGDKALRGRRARAVAALGAGIALDEVEAERVTDATIATDLSLHSRRVQTFTGPTVKQIEVIVLGNRAGVGGRLVACSTLTDDLLDVRPVKRLLIDAGLRLDAEGEFTEPSCIVAALIKSGVPQNGHVLLHPTLIFGGGIAPEKHVRATQSGVFGAVLKTTCMFNTFDPIQQAPEGGSQVCVVLSV
jgi:ring-opening amidohydrolase-like protein